MNPLISQQCIKKTPEQGFTLIELLIVILIIGVLSAMALPQMMGIIGRAREAEARSMMGAMNRAQQSFFNERTTFATSAEQLEVPVGNEKYYTIFVNAGNDATVGGLQGALGNDNAMGGTRDYAAAVGYDPLTRSFSTVVCRSTDQANQYQIAGLTSTDTTTGAGTVTGVIGGTNAQCDNILPVEELR